MTHHHLLTVRPQLDRGEILTRLRGEEERTVVLNKTVLKEIVSSGPFRLNKPPESLATHFSSGGVETKNFHFRRTTGGAPYFT